jgi:hypothetical protein
VEEIEVIVRKEINWAKLSIEDALLVDRLISTVRDVLLQTLKEEDISSENRIAVSKVFRWVSEAAQLRMVASS